MTVKESPESYSPADPEGHTVPAFRIRDEYSEPKGITVQTTIMNSKEWTNDQGQTEEETPGTQEEMPGAQEETPDIQEETPDTQEASGNGQNADSDNTWYRARTVLNTTTAVSNGQDTSRNYVSIYINKDNLPDTAATSFSVYNSTSEAASFYSSLVREKMLYRMTLRLDAISADLCLDDVRLEEGSLNASVSLTLKV